MDLKTLMAGVYSGPLPGDLGTREVKGVVCDSRQVAPGTLFVAVSGRRGTGEDYAAQALARGALAVVSERSEGPGPRLTVPDAGWVLRRVTRRLYGRHRGAVKVIGVTGTNGKTTVTHLLEAIFEHTANPCGVIGTIEHRTGREVYSPRNTTPGYVTTHRLLAEMAEAGRTYALVEVSSHALDQGRVRDIDFRQAVFTNLTDEHLDYHGSRQAYFEAKARLFRGLSRQAVAVLNADDPWSPRLAERTRARVRYYGVEAEADLRAEVLEETIDGMRLAVRLKSGQRVETRASLIGRHNQANILAALAAALEEGVDLVDAARAVETFAGVPGRLERVSLPSGPRVLIDYAHTPDALAAVLRTLRPLVKGRLILVFGCGGDRDPSKRPVMGRLAGQWADVTFITSDNPRTEDPRGIIDAIRKGFQGKDGRVIEDRARAIAAAIREAGADDTVLLAGKGHERYQIVGTQRRCFDEREIVRRCLA